MDGCSARSKQSYLLSLPLIPKINIKSASLLAFYLVLSFPLPSFLYVFGGNIYLHLSVGAVLVGSNSSHPVVGILHHRFFFYTLQLLLDENHYKIK